MTRLLRLSALPSAVRGAGFRRPPGHMLPATGNSSEYAAVP